MLSDPKKLRTRRGFGYLVGSRDCWRPSDAESARSLAEQLLNEPGNADAIRASLGRPEAPEEDLLEWLAGALAAGSIAAVRTQRKARTMDPPQETDWRDLVGRDDAPQERPTPETSWLELEVLDELGEPIPGVRFRLASGEHGSTDARGVIRFDDIPSSFGRAFVEDPQGLIETLRSRWAAPRQGDWFEPTADSHLTVSGLHNPLPEFGLQARARHTWLIQPRVERVRIVGRVFESNKAFILPDALPRLREVVSLYGSHEGSTLVITGHTDTTGDPSVNDPLSLERAKVVQAFLEDDVDAWLAFYEHPIVSQRWGASEDALLLSHALWSLGLTGAENPVRTYQGARDLTVDGDIGSQTRRALVADFMALDGTTLPSSITAVAHGCGENHPLADDGETLDVHPPDGVEDPTDRRVEVYAFDPPLGVLPEPDHPESYRAWQRRARQTHDMLVVRPIALAVRVVDASTGTPVAGATVVLQGQNMLGASDGASTDAFGVRTFLGIPPGAYDIQARKEGFVSASTQHQVDATAQAAVVALSMTRDAAVSFAVGLKDPEGSRVPLPEGARLELVHDDGTRVETPVGALGVATVEAPRPHGGVRISMVVGDANCLLQTADGDTRMVELNEALASSREGSRFIQVPKRLEVGAPFLVLDGHDGGPTADVAALVERSTKAPVDLTIEPVWEHVCFTYFDRHHRRTRAVPGPSGVGEPALVMTGHRGGRADAEYYTAWPIVHDGNTIHALAWFLPAGGFPLETDTIRMMAPPRTFVSTLRTDEAHVRLLVVEDDMPLATHISAPHPDRLLFYDLPEQWHSDRYFGRRNSDEEKRPYATLERQTAAQSPIFVSLDDVVVMRNAGGGGREPVPLTGSFTLFDGALTVYKPIEDDPQYYGEPYFTDPGRLAPRPGATGVPAFILLDTPDDMRALVHRDVFEVFDARTTIEDPDVPVGARVAYCPFDESAASDAVASASEFCRIERRYRIPQVARDAKSIGKDTQGECAAALFRCVGSDATREHALMLQYVFVEFDFAPSGAVPPGGTRLQPAPPPAKQRRLTAQSLHLVHARWSGRPLEGPLRVFENESAPSYKLAPTTPVPTPTEFHDANDTLRCGFAAFAFRADASGGEHADQVIDVWGSGVRASMGSGSGKLNVVDLGIPEVRSTLSHEFGHVLGLPDEYVETAQYGSLGRPGFKSPGHVAGGVYGFDVPETHTDGSLGPGKNVVEHIAMMKHNEAVRPRHIACLMASLLRRAGISTAGGKWVQGERALSPIEPAHALPGAVPDHHRRRDSPVDAYLYVSGPLGFPAFRFQGSPAPEGVVVLECRIALTFPPEVHYDRQTELVRVVERALQRAARSLSCVARFRHASGPFHAAVVLGPRFLSKSVPTAANKDERDRANEYLGAIEGGGRDLPPLLGPEDAAEHIEKLEQDVEEQRHQIEALEADLAALEADPETPPINKLILADKIKRKKNERAQSEQALSLMQSSPTPGTALTKAAYDAFVAETTKFHPAHIDIEWVHSGTVHRSGSSIRVPLPLANKQRRQLQDAILELFGIEAGDVTSTALAHLLQPLLAGSPFELVGVVRE